MKPVILVVVLFVLGVGGGLLYLKANRSSPQPESAKQDASAEGAAMLHGGAANSDAAPKCSKHGIPDAVCAFCHPDLVEKLGFCAGHEVAEAYCTRCSPVLIAAFKIEKDWCEEHGLPESQCKICKGET